MFGGKTKTSFMANAAAADDPLAGVEYTGNVEVDAVTELTALQQAYRARKSSERKRFQQVTDSEYWVALCFKSRDQKEEFLAATRAVVLGDKYIDGHRFAELIGCPLKED